MYKHRIGAQQPQRHFVKRIFRSSGNGIWSLQGSVNGILIGEGRGYHNNRLPTTSADLSDDLNFPLENYFLEDLYFGWRIKSPPFVSLKNF